MSAERMLNAEEQKALLGLARFTIANELGQPTPPPPGLDQEGLKLERGAFVTLHRQGQLRGCIGSFQGNGSLHHTIEDMARAAAFRDPRFRPLAATELPMVDLEISVLTPLRPVDDVNEIEVGRHGIYILCRRGNGVLLPQVATEYGWDRQTFLEQTCRKAGLEPSCWQAPDVKILVFEAQVFGEKSLGLL